MGNGETKDGKAGQSARSREEFKHRVLKPGETFGNFRVVNCLCAGLIANYYHMQHIRDLHDVTVGVFHERTHEDLKFIKRLQILQKTLKGLEHEGIPEIRDSKRINERICIFLDPVKGRTLSQYFEAHAKPGQEGLGAESTTRILAQLLGLLGYAHSKGLDHRDIDSDMIFIQEDGSICLLGLGVKAALGTELFEAIVSASVSPLASNDTQGRLNSFDVLSPEYKAGLPEDSRVDLFCVGAIGYWLLTGRKPARSNLKMPTDLVPSLSPEWDAFFKNLLERNRDARFQSCRAALLALKENEEEPESERGGFVQRQIDYMPVPRGILDRGEVAIRVYRLSLIGLIGVTLTALAAFFLEVSFMEEAVYDRDVAQVVGDGQKPQLVVEVQPPVSKIEFSGFEESFITENGRLELRVIPGQYKLRASAHQHIDKIERVTVEAEAKDGPQKVSFDLVPAWTDIRIRSEPGATISVTDDHGVETELGVTDETGNFALKEKLVAGTYQVIVKKEGYAPTVLHDQAFNFGEVSSLEAPLTPLAASLTVRTNPSGARITVNDDYAGLSPLVLDELAPGKPYLIVARLENYRPTGRRVELGPGQDRVLDLAELTPKSGQLQLKASFEGLDQKASEPLLKETSVVLGDLRYPFGSPELKSVPEGEYVVQLEHPLYVSAPIELSLADGEVKQLDITLTPRPGQVQLSLADHFKPSVRIDQKEVQFEDNTIPIPALKAVEFELRIENYMTMMRRFKLQPTESVIWEVEPVPIPGPSRGQDWTLPYLGLELAWIPPGHFLMGSSMREQGRLPNEGEPTEVTFTEGFWAGVHEVTQAVYRKVMDEGPSEFLGAKHPVDTVTWKEANAFCQALTESERAAGRLPEGYVYRLPTEAEWEYAARAGTTTVFHFGEQADTSHGNFRGVYPREADDGSRTIKTYGTEPVGNYPRNAYGLHDIHGNVSEWTIDTYRGRLPGGRLTDPTPRREGDRYALRGGSWENFAVRARVAARAEARVDAKSNAIGFRVFLAPDR